MRFNILMSTALTLGVPAIIAVLTKLVPGICWAPRVGGVMVGCSLLMQGYIFANSDKFAKKLRSGITFEQRLMHIIYVVAIWGTILNAFGDLIPSMYGVDLRVPK